MAISPHCDLVQPTFRSVVLDIKATSPIQYYTHPDLQICSIGYQGYISPIEHTLILTSYCLIIHPGNEFSFLEPPVVINNHNVGHLYVYKLVIITVLVAVYLCSPYLRLSYEGSITSKQIYTGVQVCLRTKHKTVWKQKTGWAVRLV